VSPTGPGPPHRGRASRPRLRPARHPCRPDDPLRPAELPLPRRPAPAARPYHQWTRKKNGKTATRILTGDQAADYQPWFDSHRRLRELITELEELSLTITEADPRWNR
jgi:hypothetical protein